MKKSLSQKAFDYMFEKIISGDIAPGTMLNRRSVASELNMSPVPVMEAMVRLESEGFLKAIQRKGTIVCVTSKEDIKAYMFLREAIECQAAREYCGETIIKNEKKLKAIAEKFNTSINGPLDTFNLEYEFHCLLIRLTESQKVIEVFEKAMKQILYYKVNKHPDRSDVNENSDHMQLLEHLKTDDPDKAEKIIRQHFNSDF